MSSSPAHHGEKRPRPPSQRARKIRPPQKEREGRRGLGACVGHRFSEIALHAPAGRGRVVGAAGSRSARGRRHRDDPVRKAAADGGCRGWTCREGRRNGSRLVWPQQGRGGPARHDRRSDREGGRGGARTSGGPGLRAMRRPPLGEAETRGRGGLQRQMQLRAPVAGGPKAAAKGGARAGLGIQAWRAISPLPGRVSGQRQSLRPWAASESNATDASRRGVVSAMRSSPMALLHLGLHPGRDGRDVGGHSCAGIPG